MATIQSIFRVMSQTQPVEITKQDGSKLAKSTIVLQFPGSRYEDSFSATLLGNAATVVYRPSQLVWAALRFQARQVGDGYLTDVTAQEIIAFGN